MRCPKEWELHYVHKIRSTKVGSSLFFGSAIDAACESYALNQNPEMSRAVFKEKMQTQEINNEPTDLPSCTQIEYMDSDFDPELFSESDNQSILTDTPFVTVQELYDDLKQKEDIDSKKLYAYINWLSLFRKGEYLVNRFMDVFDSEISEVLLTQGEIEFEDNKGNKIIGKPDFLARLKKNNQLAILDLKTTSSFYQKNSVVESNQLALYIAYYREFYPGLSLGGYIVLNKKIKKNKEKICSVCGHDDSGKATKTCTNLIEGKRCSGEYNIRVFPEATGQFILDKVPESKIESVVEDFNSTVQKVELGEFPQNTEACVRFGGKFKCPYYEYCRSGSMVDLIKKE